MPEYIKYDDLFATWDNPLTQTPFANDNLKDAEKKIIPLYRELANMLKKSPLVNNGDLEAMNLHKKGPHTHHHAPIADTPPAFYIIAVEGNRLRVFYYPEGARHRKGKPKGQHGVEIKWGFSSVVVINPENLPYSVFDTASPHTLQFSPNDYGKTVYIAMRWENTRGKKGPWSTVMTVNVP
jgi:hypothetical protein